jgi:ParB family chromosome partitioning protein
MVELRLGRGLAALMGEMGEENAALDRARTGSRRAPVAHLKPSARNPRRSFDEGDLEALAQSIRERGIVQPILVRPIPGERDRFEIVAGERRWRAAQRAGLHEAPIVIVEASDKEALEIAIIENVQRADLDPLEEAAGYQQLLDEFAYTQDQLSRVIGKSRSHVANTLRLLGVSDVLKAHLRERRLTPGHVRAIMTTPSADILAETIIAGDLSVREAEALAQSYRPEVDGGPAPRPVRPPKDADTEALERALSDSLGLKVSIDHRGRGGKIEISYKSLDQLDEICRRLQG